MLSELEASKVSAFFESFSDWESAYKYTSISYFACKIDRAFVLLQARLFFRATPIASATTNYFESSNVRVGHFLLSSINKTPKIVVDELLKGILLTPNGTLKFKPEANGSFSVSHIPIHHEGQQNGMRISVLTIIGDQPTQLPDQQQLDWELKATSTPYDNLNELLVENNLVGQNFGNRSYVELIVSPACEVDSNAKINGSKASPAVLLSDQLDPTLCSLGYRVFQQGKVIKRSFIPGSSMQWESRPPILYGSTTVDIPPGSVLHCFGSYKEVTQHQAWLSDPNTVQNPNRAVYETFDSRLTILRDFLENSQGRGRDARDLEIGIAWLLWMLGFSVAHLGGTAKTQDAPDLVATTPSGHFVVIECTTGLLKADNKLSRLIERAEVLKRSLEASGNRHLHVLPVIVSSKSTEEIRADLEQAEKLGVLVLAKESLHKAVDQSLIRQNADQIYLQAERVILEKQQKKSYGFGTT